MSSKADKSKRPRTAMYVKDGKLMYSDDARRAKAIRDAEEVLAEVKGQEEYKLGQTGHKLGRSKPRTKPPSTDVVNCPNASVFMNEPPALGRSNNSSTQNRHKEHGGLEIKAGEAEIQKLQQSSGKTINVESKDGTIVVANAQVNGALVDENAMVQVNHDNLNVEMLQQDVVGAQVETHTSAQAEYHDTKVSVMNNEMTGVAAGARAVARYEHKTAGLEAGNVNVTGIDARVGAAVECKTGTSVEAGNVNMTGVGPAGVVADIDLTGGVSAGNVNIGATGVTGIQVDIKPSIGNVNLGVGQPGLTLAPAIGFGLPTIGGFHGRTRENGQSKGTTVSNSGKGGEDQKAGCSGIGGQVQSSTSVSKADIPTMNKGTVKNGAKAPHANSRYSGNNSTNPGDPYASNGNGLQKTRNLSIESRSTGGGSHKGTTEHDPFMDTDHTQRNTGARGRGSIYPCFGDTPKATGITRAQQANTRLSYGSRKENERPTTDEEIFRVSGNSSRGVFGDYTGRTSTSEKQYSKNTGYPYTEFPRSASREFSSVSRASMFSQAESLPYVENGGHKNMIRVKQGNPRQPGSLFDKNNRTLDFPAQKTSAKSNQAKGNEFDELMVDLVNGELGYDTSCQNESKPENKQKPMILNRDELKKAMVEKHRKISDTSNSKTQSSGQAGVTGSNGNKNGKFNNNTSGETGHSETEQEEKPPTPKKPFGEHKNIHGFHTLGTSSNRQLKKLGKNIFGFGN